MTVQAVLKNLHEIEADVLDLAKLIGCSSDQLPTYGSTRDLGYAHIEVDRTRYYYVVVERGEELERRSTEKYDELLYWIFEHATHCLAFRYEAVNRVEGQDFRRIAFARQLELLNRIDTGWAMRRAAAIAETLRQHPYHDSSE